MEAVTTPAPLWPIAAVKALRPKQWTKNGVLLVPLIFAKSAVEGGLVVKALVAVIAFSLLASGVYVVNDWVDREKDRLHPEKRKRPIAAGHLGFGSAMFLVALCWAGAGALGWWLGLPFLGVLGGYLLLQVLYTGGLKHMVLLDVMAIALGFILRVVAGATAIDVSVSNWLFLCTLLGAVFLGFAKRRAELSSLEEAASHRANLADYTVPMLPSDKPRYLMGVGRPGDIVGAVKRGIDMFDCVMPTRAGRTAQAFTRRGELNMRNARHRDDPRPIDEQCGCPACRHHSRAYLHHLIRADEILGSMLLTWHNLHYYQDVMRGLRGAIESKSLDSWIASFESDQALGDIPPL